MYKRVLLKLSGEALSNDQECFDVDVLNSISLQIKKLVDSGVEVAIVVGGGNFVRGRSLSKLGFDRVASDNIGMLGTVMNAMALEEVLLNLGLKAKAMSAIDIGFVTPYNAKKARRLLSKNTVLIFGGGIANPYFSTDTCSALRACEINAEVILMAKNGVDGVYTDDPDTNPDAKRYDVLTFDDILNKNLKVIDATAASLCKEQGIKAFVFNMSDEDNIVKAVFEEAVGTLIEV